MSQYLKSPSGCKHLLLIFLLLAGTMLSGCSTVKSMFSNITFGETEDPKSLPPETLITQGMDAYNVGDYSTAIKAFKAILDEHPFSSQAMLAELKTADAHYYDKKYPEAKVLYKVFEEHHPTNEATPYVMFQIGMCDFTRSDRIDRDVSGPQNAIKSFNRLLHAYPQSPYAKEAKARIKDSKEFIVNHEYLVAVFYVRTNRYEEAKHRLKYLLAMHPDSSLAPQAKALLEQLQAGKPPVWGMRKWLPEFMTTAPADRKEDTVKPEEKEKPPAAPEKENGQSQKDTQ